jgi:hypothetical protein
MVGNNLMFLIRKDLKTAFFQRLRCFKSASKGLSLRRASRIPVLTDGAGSEVKIDLKAVVRKMQPSEMAILRAARIEAIGAA